MCIRDSSYVYKKGKHGRLEKQYVEVGKNMYGSIEIVFGLTMEDEIAFPYGRNVKEGAKTKTVESLSLIHILMRCIW